MDIYKTILNNSNYHKFFITGDRVVLEVYFSDGGKIYCYEGDSEKYTQGEKVMVSTTEAYKDVTIKDVYYYSQEDYPFRELSLKRIVKRLDDDVSNHPVKTTNSMSFELNNSRNVPVEIGSITQEVSPRIQQATPAEKQVERKTPWGIIAAIIACLVLFGPSLRDMYLDLIPLEREDVAGVWESGHGSIVFNSDGSIEVSSEDVGGAWSIINSDTKTISFSYSISDEQADMYNEMLFGEIPELYYDTEGLGLTEEEIIDDLIDDGIIPEDGEYIVDTKNGIMRNGDTALNKLSN